MIQALELRLTCLKILVKFTWSCCCPMTHSPKHCAGHRGIFWYPDVRHASHRNCTGGSPRLWTKCLFSLPWYCQWALSEKALSEHTWWPNSAFCHMLYVAVLNLYHVHNFTQERPCCLLDDRRTSQCRWLQLAANDFVLFNPSSTAQDPKHALLLGVFHNLLHPYKCRETKCFACTNTEQYSLEWMGTKLMLLEQQWAVHTCLLQEMQHR